ncbi:MAG: adenosylmethionine decarboxylase [Thermoprotei archaeon]|nr:MAG: adenosylmethionine decarboxylase [Thermoprotei archaeon]RLF01669.1 MAG: adenosylmethionine decarboxylase [Thermoprotei archaeon]
MKEREKVCSSTCKNLSNVVVGRHVYGNLYDIEPSILSNEKLLKETVIKAAELANTKLIEVKSWVIEGDKGGVSVIALIEESHIAIHTWVKYGYATVDVYTCGEKSDPWKAFSYILDVLKPRTHQVFYADRSSIQSV